MAITGVYNTQFEIEDEVLYIDPNDSETPYMNGVVNAVIPIAGGPDMLNVLLENGQYVYHNVSRFVKVYKMHTAKIKPLFKPGDRVIWNDKPFNAKRKGTVLCGLMGQYYTVQVDGKFSKYNTFNIHVDKLEPIPKEDIMDKEYAVKCAKWFKSAYASITKAGGVPEIVIDSIPVDVLDNLIRNDLHLEYKK